MPLLAYRLFERITGRKREPWLVKTVGLITMVIAWTLASDPAGRHRQTRRLGLSAALAYGAIDIWYAAVRRRISPVYLLDAAVEGALVIAWLVPPLVDQSGTEPPDGYRGPGSQWGLGLERLRP